MKPLVVIHQGFSYALDSKYTEKVNAVSQNSFHYLSRTETYLFEALHAQRDGEMYWDSRHILDDLGEWSVFVRLRNDRPVGAIYSRRGKKLGEIFGIDYFEGRYDPESQADLLQAAIQASKADGSQYLVYFCDDREKPVACRSGFSCVGKYLLVEGSAPA